MMSTTFQDAWTYCIRSSPCQVNCESLHLFLSINRVKSYKYKTSLGGIDSIHDRGSMDKHFMTSKILMWKQFKCDIG